MSTASVVKSQDGYLQSYDFLGRGLGFDNLLLKEDTLIVYGNVQNPESAQWGLYFAKLDTMGNILSEQTHYDSLGDTYLFDNGYKMINTSDDGFAIVGQLFLRNHPILVKLDQNGQLEFVREYPDDTVLNIRHWNVVETISGYISTGVKQQLTDGYWDAFIMGTDKAGNKLWETSYGMFGVWDQFPGIVEIAQDDFLLTGSTCISSSQVENKEDMWCIPKAIKIDSTGIITWEWEGEISYFTGGSIASLRQVFPTMDQNWVNPGSIAIVTADNELKYQAQIMKRDAAFNILWNTPFGQPTSNRNRFTTLAPAPDGGWVAVGEYVNRPEGDPLGGYQAAMIAKVNADGDSLWSRTDTLFDHTMIASRPYLGGVVVLPSGSIIACGRVDKTFPDPAKSYGILIKVDREGCMEPNCNPITNSTNLTPLIASFKVFPNPAQDRILVRGEGRFDLQIMDQNGRLIVSVNDLWEEGEVDLADFAAGTYFLQVQQGSARLTKKILKQ